jgi:cytochrome c-type biogenesis protein CcmF
MGFQVLMPTSIPVWNKIVGLFGGTSNMAPPADQINYYSKFQLWFAVVIGFLSAVGQFFWWKKMDKDQLRKELLPPALIALILFALIITIGKIYTPSYMVLTLAGIFTVVANAKILISLLKTSPALSGGAVAHIGVGMMLIGIMFSSGYSNVVSLNNTGLLISKEFSEEFNRENLLLFLHEPRTMAGYELEYLGERWEPRNKSGYVNKTDVIQTFDPYKVVAKSDIVYQGRKLYNTRDTFEIYPENTYYEIAFRKDGRTKYFLYPRVQINERMGGFVPSPDIIRNVRQDIYTHVTAPMSPEAKEDWSETEEIRVKANQEFYANDYVTVVENLERIFEVNGEKLEEEDVAVKAVVRVKGEKQEYVAEPVFHIRNKMVRRIPAEVYDLGLKFTLINIHPETNEFSIGINSRQKDWVVLKALEKPYINVLWIGTLMLMAGFGIAMVRRFREFNKMKIKGLE